MASKSQKNLEGMSNSFLGSRLLSIWYVNVEFCTKTRLLLLSLSILLSNPLHFFMLFFPMICKQLILQKHFVDYDKVTISTFIHKIISFHAMLGMGNSD